jgi:HEAT repeat protein
LVEEAYASGDAFLVQSSLLAMGRSVNAAWGPRVLAELHNPSPALRAEAVRAAGELELHDAISDLIELTEDVDREVRRAAIWSLAQLGGGRAAGVLTNLLETTEDESEIALLEDALDYLAFVDGTRDIALFDFDDDQDLAD